jgi:spermidine/putrescine transport system substrate-binding protein
MEQILTDPALKGKVTLLNEMADTVGLVMQLNGADPVEVTDESFDAAIAPIEAAVESGQIRQFTGNDYSGPLAKGDLIACVAWSGDLVQLQADNPSLKWVVPDDGGMIWTDNMLIPLGGDVEKASTFMNFVYDPKIAAQIAAYVNYVTPVKGAKEALEASDPELADNQLIFPDDATLAKVKQFNSEALNNQDYIEKWQSIAAA